MRVVLVTGPSGAGRSTAIRLLEDNGFEAIDNLPLNLLPRLLDGAPPERPLALGLDVRNRDFSPARFLEAVASLRARPEYDTLLLYLDSRPDILLRRFSETRRPHPISGTAEPSIGVEREIELLSDVRVAADVLIDTSDLTPHHLRDELARRFAADDMQHLSVSVHSFSFKRGLPPSLDTVFDVRFLKNPHWIDALRDLDGRDESVRDHVAGDPRFEEFYARLGDFILSLLPAYSDEGKSHLAIGLGCTGGRHRSVAVAEMLGKNLAEAGWPVSIRHRELERRAEMAASKASG